MLEGWSEEDRAMLLIQSIQLTWKFNLLPTYWSGTLFCRGLLLSTNVFVMVWTFLQVGERAGIHSYTPMILYARRMVRRGQSYAVDSKRSIDLKTQFFNHVSIRYSILPRPSFINKWFGRGLDVSLSWGESRNPLRIDWWFCLLEVLDPGFST